jgi:predicted SprT family Zn-dependent metalloprotease
LFQQEILNLILKLIEKQNAKKSKMNRILYENRCKCNEEISITKKRKSNTRSEGKPLQYPKSMRLHQKHFK